METLINGMKKKNEVIYYFSNTLYNTAIIVSSGAILQTFMMEMRIPENTIAQYISLFQVVQSMAMIFLGSIADKIKNIIKVNALSILNALLLLIPMFVFAMFDSARYNAGVIFLIFGTLSNIVLGFYNIITYKLPYHIMDMKNYGRILASIGVLQGIICVIASAVMTNYIGKCDYFDTMKIIVSIAIILTIASFIISIRYTNIFEYIDNKTEKINIFKYKPFQMLIIPNLARGVGMGIIVISVTIGYFFDVIDKVSSGYIIIVTNVAVILSSFLYSRIAKTGRNGKIVLISAVAATVFISFMLVGKSTVVFLVCYAIGYIAVNLLGMAVPVLITEIIDYNVAGQYSAWRMMLLTIGSAIGGFFAIPMCERFGGVFTFVFAGIMFLITGAGYYGCEKLMNNR